MKHENHKKFCNDKKKANKNEIILKRFKIVDIPVNFKETQIFISIRILGLKRKKMTSTTPISDEKTGTLEGESVSDTETLYILGAVYGLQDVTEVVKRLVTNDQLVVFASNKVFGDSRYEKQTNKKGVKKTLVVVYKYGGDAYAAGVAFVEEDKKLVITRNTRKWYFHEFNLRPNKLTIFGAVYGLEDMTTKTRNLVSRQELIVNVSNETFGDTWPSCDLFLYYFHVYTYITSLLLLLYFIFIFFIFLFTLLFI
ncbi:hypothetical protein RFI_28019 [Reticulomyxa filosa]|uniref:Uncharacterized protein n=1 Tax=Reticulomyxa filosa TaxID=46433 RepID=X6M5T8_RETFI|nr:hypothetical protein RFI_28019 [Reticulomyxa filosa]|eukprot:ETO09358.1 hypothetical protein RFI_28019 [Reticulomyxa filosa]